MKNRLIELVKEFQTTFGQYTSEIPSLAPMEVCEMRYKIQLEELDEYRTACTEGNLEGIYDSLLDQLYVLLGTFNVHGLHNTLAQGFEEVHRSNMSKLDKDGKVIYREDGKILKSDLFSPPDLKKILSLS